MAKTKNDLKRWGWEWVAVAFFCILGWQYARQTPLLETPDEPSHFSIIQYMAQRHELPPPPTTAVTWPIPTLSPTAAEPAYYAPPLYYALGAVLIQGLETSGLVHGVVPNPSWATGSPPVPGRDGVNKNAYVHTADQRPPYAGWAIAFQRLRLFSLMLGAATVWGTLALARQLWPRPSQWGWVWAAVTMVASNVTYLFITNGVTNDALLVPLSTWVVVAMARLLHCPPTAVRRCVIAMGVGVGLAVLTKQSAFIFVPLGLLVIYLRREQVVWQGLLFGAMVTAVGGWWYLYNGLAYGSFLGLFSHAVLESTPTLGDHLRFMAQQSGGAFLSYWAALGWALIFVHPAWYGLFTGLVVGGVGGWLRPSPTPNSWPTGAAWVLGAAVVLNGFFLVAWMWAIAAPYGRLLFPTMAPIACLLVEGWRRLLGDESRLATVWQVLITAALWALAALVPSLYLRPAFATPLVTTADLAHLTPAPTNDNPYWRLVGYELAAETITQGETAEITLYWQLLAQPPAPTDLTIFVQLAPRDPQQRVANVDEWLGTTRYPTSAWQVGDVVRQTHTLAVPVSAPAPALYWFNVGLYAADPNATPFQTGILAQLGPIRVVPTEPLSAEPTTADYTDFGDTIRLQDYEVHWSAADQTVVLTVVWHATAAPSQDWHLFVHVLDETGQLLAQQDGPPRAGEYPTNWWRQGETITDTYAITLPPHTTPATLRLGLYDWQTGQRPLATNAQSTPLPDNAVDLEIRR